MRWNKNGHEVVAVKSVVTVVVAVAVEVVVLVLVVVVVVAIVAIVALTFKWRCAIKVYKSWLRRRVISDSVGVASSEKNDWDEGSHFFIKCCMMCQVVHIKSSHVFICQVLFNYNC